MERSLDKDRKALMEDLYLAEMANPANNTDITLAKKLEESALNSKYYYPIGIVDDLRKSKPKHFGNDIVMPAISTDLDAKGDEDKSYIWSARIYYLGFNPKRVFKPKNQILNKEEMGQFKANKIAVSKNAIEFHTDKKVKVIISSDAINAEFNKLNTEIKINLNWIAFYGFDILRESGILNPPNDNDSNSTNQKIDNQNA